MDCERYAEAKPNNQDAITYTTKSLLCFAASVCALTSMTFPKVITPTRPINIKMIRTNLLYIHIDDKMPEESPAVANADVASNTISRNV